MTPRAAFSRICIVAFVALQAKMANKPIELSPLKKRPKRNHLSLGEKQVIVNLFKSECQRLPDVPIVCITSIVAEITGVVQRTVFRVLQEYKRKNQVEGPATNKKRVAYKLDKVDDVAKAAIRRKVLEFCSKEQPTIDKLLAAVNEDELLPSFKRTSFQKVLKSLNFVFEKKKGRTILLERSEERSPPSASIVAPQPFEQVFVSEPCSTSSIPDLMNGEALLVPKTELQELEERVCSAMSPVAMDMDFQNGETSSINQTDESHASNVNNWDEVHRTIKLDPDGINFRQTNQDQSDVTKSEDDSAVCSSNLELTNQDETEDITRTAQNETIERIDTTTSNSPPSMPKIKIVSGDKVIDVAAHVKLLGDRLSLIGERMKNHQGPVALSGTLSLFMDSQLCAVASLLSLTQKLPDFQECCYNLEQLQRSLEKTVCIDPSS